MFAGLPNVLCVRYEPYTVDLRMANEEVKRLHMYVSACDFWYLTSLDPLEIVVVSLEDELFTTQEVIIALDSVVASTAFLFYC